MTWQFYSGQARPPHGGAVAIVDQDGALMCVAHGETQDDAVARGNAIIRATAPSPAAGGAVGEAVDAVLAALEPRRAKRKDSFGQNYGHTYGNSDAGAALRALAARYKVGPTFDRVDQAVRVLRAATKAGRQR